MKCKIRKDDFVKVIAGKERGKTGKVLKVNPGEGWLIAEKLNIVKRHMRPGKKSRQGGIVEKEGKINISQVMVVCGKCNSPARLGRKRLEDGSGVRYCKSCGEIIEK